MPRRSLREEMRKRIAASGDDVFFPREFLDLSDEDQVSRALRELVRAKQLVRLGYGVYARAITSRLSGEAILASKNGFLGASRQVLTKLGVPWELTNAQKAYNEGRTTQVPVNAVLRVKGRFSRKLRLGSMELRVEH
jgi:hypothetical protein